MLQVHPNARTTPVTRAEITRSGEPTGRLAQCYGGKRGAEDCQDHSAKPNRLAWKATEEERTIVCAVHPG